MVCLSRWPLSATIPVFTHTVNHSFRQTIRVAFGIDISVGCCLVSFYGGAGWRFIKPNTLLSGIHASVVPIHPFTMRFQFALSAALGAGFGIALSIGFGAVFGLPSLSHRSYEFISQISSGDHYHPSVQRRGRRFVEWYVLSSDSMRRLFQSSHLRTISIISARPRQCLLRGPPL